MSSTHCVARTTIVSIAFVWLTSPALGQAPPDDLPIVGGPTGNASGGLLRQSTRSLGGNVLIRSGCGLGVGVCS